MIPVNPVPGRAIMADGPDLGKLRNAAAAGEEDTIAEQYANHTRGAVTLFADSAVRFLVMDSTGRTPNTRVYNPDETRDDSDIYTDDDYDANGDYLDDAKRDCNLGNGFTDYRAETPIVRYHPGPRWDRSP